MYDYSYGYTDPTSSLGILGGLAAIGGTIMLIFGVVGIFLIISTWKLFAKAGKPGWASIVPIYNIIVLIQIAGLPLWYIALFFVPFANIYAMFKIYIEIAHKFGKSTGFGVLSVFFSYICIPILAFSKNAVYVDGNNYQENTINSTNQFNQPDMTQNNNGFNNFENNGSNNAPFMFDQNINTQINPINQTPVEEPLNPMVEPAMPVTNPVPEPITENVTPIINTMESQQNIQPQPEVPVIETPVLESPNNIVEEPINNGLNVEVQEPNATVTYNNAPVVEETPNVIPQPVLDIPANPPVEVAPIQPEPIPAPIINQEQIPVATPNEVVSPEPQVNVIPGMEPTIAPEVQADNNFNNPNNTVM